MHIIFTIEGKDGTPEQRQAIQEAVNAMHEFLIAPNETATEKNNALQKLVAVARKKIVGETNPKKLNKKEKK